MSQEQLEERAKNLRIASLIYWERGENEASDVMRFQAIRLERVLRNADQQAETHHEVR